MRLQLNENILYEVKNLSLFKPSEVTELSTITVNNIFLSKVNVTLVMGVKSSPLSRSLDAASGLQMIQCLEL